MTQVSGRNVTYWSVKCDEQSVWIVSRKSWSTTHSLTQGNYEPTTIKHWNLINTPQHKYFHSSYYFGHSHSIILSPSVTTSHYTAEQDQVIASQW